MLPHQHSRAPFENEPRWVDLRFAHTDEQLDLKNPQFSGAVADVASALRGIPKDELQSEEVKQHRRTIRTAWGAGVALIALVIVAVGFSIQATQQRNLAEANAEAEANARTEADTQRQEAEAQRAIAESQAAIARSRELAAASVSVLDENPELATMLALESIKATAGISSSSPAGVMSLRQAVQDNRLLKRFPVAEGANFAQISGDGSTIYHASEEGRSVSAIDADTGETLWVYHDPTTNDLFGNVGLSPDETLVTLEIIDLPVIDDDSVVVDEQGNDEHPARVVVLNAFDGTVERVLVPGTCPGFLQVGNNGFSPDGRYFTVFTGTEECGNDPSADWVAVYDTTTWVEVERLQIGEMTGETAVFSGDSTTVLVLGQSDSAEAQLQSFPEGEILQTYGTMSESWAAGALSPDGERVVVSGVSGGGGVDLRPVLLDAATGERISFLDAVDDFVSFDPISFSSDGSKIAVTTRGRDYVFDGHNGRLLTTLGETTFTFSHSFTADSSRLVTTTDSGVLVWDLEGGSTNAGVALEPPGEDPVWINPDGAREGPHVAVWSLVDEPRSRFGLDGHISVIDPSSGAVTAGIRGLGIQLPDGRFVVVRSTPTEDDTGILRGPTVLWDPGSGQITELAGCVALWTDFDYVNDVTCPDGGRFFGHQDDAGLMPFAAAPDGSFFAAVSYATRDGDMAVRVWDSASLEVRSEFVVPGTRLLAGAGIDWLAFIDQVGDELFFYDVDTGSLVRTLTPPLGCGCWHLDQSEDGSVLFLLSSLTTISAFDTSDWELLGRWDAHEARIRGLAVSPDGTRLATTGEDNFVKVWDVSGLGDLTEGQPPPLLDRIPAPKPSDAVWLDDDLLGLLLAQDARWMVVSLDVDDLVSDARNRLTRGFTPVECATYQIEDCPMTLEAIRAG